MGFTRSRRYANYKGGRKYDLKNKRQLLRGTGDAEKAINAEIFYQKWQQAEKTSRYQQWKKSWKQTHG